MQDDGEEVDPLEDDEPLMPHVRLSTDARPIPLLQQVNGFCLLCLQPCAPQQRHLCPFCLIEDCIVDWNDELADAVRSCPRGLDGKYEPTPNVKYRLGTALIKMAVSRRRVKVEIEEPEPRLIRRCGLMADSADLGLAIWCRSTPPWRTCSLGQGSRPKGWVPRPPPLRKPMRHGTSPTPKM